jgi:hypothetical protein
MTGAGGVIAGLPYWAGGRAPGDGEVGGAAGEPGRRHAGQRRGLWQVLALGAAGEHPADQRHADRFGFQRPRAGGVDPGRPPLADQAQQRVDLPHLGPRQRVAQQRRGVGAGRRAGLIGQALQVADVAQRVSAGVGGQVGRVGDAAAGLLAGVGLDQLPAVVDPHQAGAGAHLNVAADQIARHRIQRLGHLDVMVAVHLRAGVDRQVIAGHRRRGQPRRLFGGEQLGRAAPGGAVDPLPGHLLAPGLRAALRIRQAGEGLPGEEPGPHIRHRPLHPGLAPHRQLHLIRAIGTAGCG